nr:MAG TPA_asm: hypothetical protein [Caudoviricetes sp.]
MCHFILLCIIIFCVIIQLIIRPFKSFYIIKYIILHLYYSN